MLVIMPVGIAWDHLWSKVPCPRLGDFSGCDKILYQSTRFKKPTMSEKAALNRFLLMDVKCTTYNEREAMKCFRKNLHFLVTIIVRKL